MPLPVEECNARAQKDGIGIVRCTSLTFRPRGKCLLRAPRLDVQSREQPRCLGGRMRTQLLYTAARRCLIAARQRHKDRIAQCFEPCSVLCHIVPLSLSRKCFR